MPPEDCGLKSFVAPPINCILYSNQRPHRARMINNEPNNNSAISNSAPNGTSNQQTTQIGTGQNIVVNVGQNQTLRGPIVDPTRLWSSDLCDCCMDCGTCKYSSNNGSFESGSDFVLGAMSWFCPCVQVGMNATKVSNCSSPHLEGCCCGFWYCMLWLMCLGYFFGCGLRMRIRERNRIYGYALIIIKIAILTILIRNPCGDCCTHFWCPFCAVAQEGREVKYRLKALRNAQEMTTASPVVSQMPNV